LTTQVSTQHIAAAVKAYVEAFCGYGQAASDAAAPYIAEDVDLVSPPLHVYGHAGIMERISGHWPGMGMYKQAAWSEPAVDGNAAKVEATMPEGLPTKSLTISFNFNDAGLIQHVEVAQVRGTPPAPGPVKLTQEIKDLVNNSLANDAPIVLGYMAKDGQPSVSLRGSMVVISETQLAFWSRNPEGGVTKAPEYNSKMTVLYRDTPNRINLLFQGDGRVEKDEAVRNQVFELMPQIEKDHDEPRRGACVVIDLKSVSGATLSGPVRMANP
jgi:hypothetical protein